jgi:O-antigen/teichoic acid export membrane protein
MNIKLFAKDAILYGVANASLRAAAFLLIPLYTHALSVKDFGILSTLLITMQLMIMLITLGMQNTLLRFAKEYEDKNLLGGLISTSMVINLIAGILLTLFVVFFLKTPFRVLLHIEHVFDYLLLTSIAALVQTVTFQVMSYYRAKDKALKFTVISILAALILIGSNLNLLLVFQLGIKGVLYSTILSYSIVFVYVFIDVFLRKIGFAIVIEIIPKVLRFGYPFVFSMLGQLVITSGSIYFLSYFEGPEVVAVYSLGYKFAMMMGIMLTLPFRLALQPFVFNNIDSPSIKEKMARLFTYFFITFAFIALFVLLVARFLLPVVAPPEYSAAFVFIIFLLPLLACDGLFIFGEILLAIENKTHIIGTTVGICAVLSLFLNYILVPSIGCYGAIVASFVSCFCAGLILMIQGSKAFLIPIKPFRTIFAVGLFVYFLIVISLLYPHGNLIFYSGAFIAICFLWPLLIFVNFFDDAEKGFIRDWLQLARIYVNK